MATEATRAAPPSALPRRSPRTISRLWRDAAAAGRPTPAYLVETDEGWREVSWTEAAQRIDEVASGLLALGLRKGDRLAILGATRVEWALLDFAATSLGLVVVPIYPTSSERDVAYILSHAQVVAVAVEDDDQRATVEARADSTGVQHVLTFAELDDVAARGRAHAAEHPHALAEMRAAVGDEDVAMVVYTSGTTGAPKGCVLLHRNFVAAAEAVEAVRELIEPDDVALLFLPLAHTFAQLVLFAGTAVGFSIAFCPDAHRVADAAASVRPTLLPSVPRAYEKLHAAVLAQFEDATGIRRRLIAWAVRVGTEVASSRRAGVPPSASLALQHRLADRLVYSRVKARLGGRIRVAISGAAPIAVDVLEFLHALDILVLEGYGLTECASACSLNRPDRFRFGTVGQPLPGVDVRIESDGEIAIRGENVFAGYLRDDDATRQALTDDGWLLTGDVGELDADGFLRITDRKKEIIVTAGGKNVAPQALENELKSESLVSAALVVGDRRPYLVALFTLDEHELRRFAETARLRGSTAELAVTADVHAVVQNAVDRVNRGRARFEQIQRFAILPREFSQELGELTPTLKVRRRVCEEHFASEIEALYR